MQVVDVAENTKAIRSLDWDRDRFDIEFSLDIGTTYNSYLIFGAGKTALVDASHEKFRGTYLPVLQDQLKAAGCSLDYIIVSHTEPDHSGEPRHWACACPSAKPSCWFQGTCHFGQAQEGLFACGYVQLLAGSSV